MESQEVEDILDDPKFRWAGIIVGVFSSLAAAHSMWQHGLRSLDWSQDAALAVFCFSFVSGVWRERSETRRRWRTRVFWIAYGTFFGTWIGHENGWVPGGCTIALFVLPAIAPERGWSGGIKKALGILVFVLVAVGGTWFVKGQTDWVPYACLFALLLLLACEKPGRRSIKKNLLRPASAGWMLTAGAAFFWLWKGPSFASIILFVAVLVLWFGNFLFHISSGERLALPHPQS